MTRPETKTTRTRERRPRHAIPVAAWIVACLALVSGVGIVSLRQKPVASTPTAARVVRQVRAMCTRVVEVTFNPRVARGLKIAKVAFRFTYRIAPGDRELVRSRIETDWDRLVSHCLEALIQRTPRELKDTAGLQAVSQDLLRAIDDVLFEDGSGRAEEILWQQIVVQ